MNILARATLVVVTAWIWGCGGGGTTTSNTPATTTTVPANASWTLRLDDVIILPVGTRLSVTPQLTLNEANGVGYHINFIRFEVVASGGTDRYEFGSDNINVGNGGNFVAPGTATVTLSGTYIINVWRGSLSELRITVGLSDDNGKSVELVVRRIGDEARGLQESLERSLRSELPRE